MEMRKTLQFFPDRLTFLKDYSAFVDQKLSVEDVKETSLEKDEDQMVLDILSNHRTEENVTSPLDKSPKTKNTGEMEEDDVDILNVDETSLKSAMSLFTMTQVHDPEPCYTLVANVHGISLDVYKCYMEVICRGGYQKVSTDIEWMDVARTAQLFSEETSILDKRLENPLKGFYVQYLLPYECEQREKLDSI